MDARAPLKLLLGICVPENRTKVFPRGPHVFLRDTPSSRLSGSQSRPDKSLAAGWASPPLQTSNDPWHSFARVGLVRRVGGPKPSEVVHLLCSVSEVSNFSDKTRTHKQSVASLDQSSNRFPSFFVSLRAARVHSTDSITRRFPPCQPPACPLLLAPFGRGRSVTSHSAFGSRYRGQDNWDSVPTRISVPLAVSRRIATSQIAQPGTGLPP